MPCDSCRTAPVSRYFALATRILRTPYPEVFREGYPFEHFLSLQHSGRSPAHRLLHLHGDNTNCPPSYYSLHVYSYRRNAINTKPARCTTKPVRPIFLPPYRKPVFSRLLSFNSSPFCATPYSQPLPHNPSRYLLISSKTKNPSSSRSYKPSGVQKRRRTMIRAPSQTQMEQPTHPLSLSLSLSKPIPTPPASRTAPTPFRAPHGLGASVGQSENANPKFRPAMEDEMAVVAFDTFPGLFLAVYDGHGGKLAARLVREHLHCLFLEELLTDEQDVSKPSVPTLSMSSGGSSHDSECSTPPYDMSVDTDTEDGNVSTDGMPLPMQLANHPANTSNLDVKSAFCRAYARMDLQLRTRRCLCVGTTSVTVFVRRVPGVGRVLSAANCGDARAVLSSAGRAVRLSFDHRPIDVEERERVESCGGFVSCRRVNGVLNVSRALGDHSMKSVVVSTPYLNELVLTDMDEFVILACDGLWDVVNDQEAVRFAQDCFDRGMDVNETSAALVKEAIDKGTTDNVSVMVAQFDMDGE